MTAVDTNVLMYAHDPRDPAKQAKAVAFINSLTDGALLCYPRVNGMEIVNPFKVP